MVDRKSIWPVKYSVSNPEGSSSKYILEDLTWSKMQNNRPAEQKPEVMMYSVVVQAVQS